jgi:hypothetical protein
MVKIIGYTYKAENYTPEALAKVIDAEAPEDRTHWAYDPRESYLTVEEMLNDWAQNVGINRQDEYSFDSNDFPKVIFDTDEEN